MERKLGCLKSSHLPGCHVFFRSQVMMIFFTRTLGTNSRGTLQHAQTLRSGTSLGVFHPRMGTVIARGSGHLAGE